MTCKDCIHCEACERMISDTSKMFKVLLSEILEMNCDIKHDSTNILSGAEICQCFQARSRFVELPCKAGDTFFVIIESSDILEYKVSYIGIFRGEVYDDISIVLDRNYHRIKYTKGRFEYELGKTIFFTEEEAEQALKERE